MECRFLSVSAKMVFFTILPSAAIFKEKLLFLSCSWQDPAGFPFIGGAWICARVADCWRSRVSGDFPFF